MIRKDFLTYNVGTKDVKCSIPGIRAASLCQTNLKFIISGMVIIAEGFVWDDSAFTGHLEPMNIFFDGLGLCLIGFGAYKLSRHRQPQQLTAPASKANSYQ